MQIFKHYIRMASPCYLDCCDLRDNRLNHVMGFPIDQRDILTEVALIPPGAMPRRGEIKK
jgi:hypothetical protein